MVRLKPRRLFRTFPLGEMQLMNTPRWTDRWAGTLPSSERATRGYRYGLPPDTCTDSNEREDARRDGTRFYNGNARCSNRPRAAGPFATGDEGLGDEGGFEDARSSSARVRLSDALCFSAQF